MDSVITLAHGNGGRKMRELIEQVFAPAFGMDCSEDAAAIALPEGEVMVTTDGFTVQPLQFPGGDIGSLAVYGTVNDLAVAGTIPCHLTLAVFIEEGFPIPLLRTLAESLGAAARMAGVRIAAGDTKVLPRGQGGGVYFAVTGIGVRPRGCRLGLGRIRTGDALLVSGPVGDHGIAVLLARENFGLQADLHSDSASLLPLTCALLDLPGLRFMRDITRGGLATVAHEIAQGTGLGIALSEAAIPVRDATATICAMLGYDPLYLACEGRVLAVLAPEDVPAAMAAWTRLGAAPAMIGEVAPGGPVTLTTLIGGARLLPELEDDPLPRIC